MSGLEAIAFISAGLALKTLVFEAWKSVEEVLKAGEIVEGLRTNLETLRQELNELKPVIDKINEKVRDKDGLLMPHVHKLGELLVQAIEKAVEKAEKLQKKKQRSKVLMTLMAIFKQGAAKQHKEIEDVRKAIKDERIKFHEVLVISGYLITEDILGKVTNTDNRVEELCRHINQSVTERPLSIIIGVPPVIDDLDRWANDCCDDESCSVSIQIAKRGSNVFFNPGEAFLSHEVNEDDKEGETHRGGREGGWEVEDSTKVQFHIEVKDKCFCFFYLLGFEKDLPVPTNLELLFPKSGNLHNKISLNSLNSWKRKFPDPRRFKNDPPSFKVERSKSLRNTGEVGQVLLYVLLMQDQLDINHIIEQLGSTVVREDFYINRVLFDVEVFKET